MANLYKGSSGSEVKKLQTLLNQNGYTLDVDGSFGSKTEAAVRDYQQKNGLAVDGIAGANTIGSLNKSTAAAPSAASGTAQASIAPLPAAAPAPYDPASDNAYQQAIAALQAAEKSAPVYSGSYDGQLRELYDKIVNRDKFSYDINSDALYRQYADQYAQQGRLAMMDTMGQAAALTGGYGSSYGQAAGQQAYNAYLQQLNDIVPELYNQAYGQYQDDGNALMQQYAMLGDLSDNEYGRYQDEYNRWLTERSFAQSQADTAYDRGYQNYLQQLGQYNTDREYQFAVDKFAYQREQDAAAAAAKSAKSGSSTVETPSEKPVDVEAPVTENTVDEDEKTLLNALLAKEITPQEFEEYLSMKRRSEGNMRAR